MTSQQSHKDSKYDMSNRVFTAKVNLNSLDCNNEVTSQFTHLCYDIFESLGLNPKPFDVKTKKVIENADGNTTYKHLVLVGKMKDINKALILCHDRIHGMGFNKIKTEVDLLSDSKMRDEEGKVIQTSKGKEQTDLTSNKFSNLPKQEQGTKQHEQTPKKSSSPSQTQNPLSSEANTDNQKQKQKQMLSEPDKMETKQNQGTTALTQKEQTQNTQGLNANTTSQDRKQQKPHQVTPKQSGGEESSKLQNNLPAIKFTLQHHQANNDSKLQAPTKNTQSSKTANTSANPGQTHIVATIQHKMQDGGNDSQNTKAAKNNKMVIEAHIKNHPGQNNGNHGTNHHIVVYYNPTKSSESQKSQSTQITTNVPTIKTY